MTTRNMKRIMASQSRGNRIGGTQGVARALILSAAIGLGVVTATSSHVGAAGARAAAPAQAARVATPARTPASAEPGKGFQAREVLDQYCVTCHNQRLKTGGLALDTLDVAKVGDSAAIWEKVHNKLRGGLMPPRAAKALPDAVRADLVSWAETSLDRAAAANPNPGRAEIFHRVNRVEYRNIVRDLLALDIDVSEFLPEDDAGGGFDNMASLLRISPSLMDAYLAASQTISRMAMGRAAAAAPVELAFPVNQQQPQYEWIEGLPFGTRGGTIVNYNFPVDGEYAISVVLSGGRNWYLTETLYALLDGEIVQTVRLPGRKEQNERPPEAVAADARLERLAPDVVEAVKYYLEQKKPAAAIAELMGVAQADVDAVAYKMANGGGNLFFRLPVKGGPHELAITFAETVFPVLEGARKPFETPGRVADGVVPQPYVGTVKIVGPYNAAGIKDTPSLEKIFVCRPASAAQEPACAKTILSSLARRAYRRPVTDKDLNVLLAFYKDARASGGGFAEGIEAGVRRLLVSPNFLYRIEIPPARAAGTPAASPASATASSLSPISDIALASRLSFFLWSSIPDDRLLQLAERRQLHQPAVLAREITRMLADSRASAIVDNFAGQWLKLRAVETQEPYDLTFPDYDASLQAGLKRELELFFASIYKDDRSVLDLVTADYTFVNDRVARHYGMSGIQGAHFRRVTLPSDSPRLGLLGKGAILLVTSNNARTSPVRRGKWILENILGTPPPAPPANVPALPERRQGNLKLISMRDRMAQHRANPVCASCHSMIDPLGFALEQFDPVGRFRLVDEAYKAIDVAGSMPDGTKFDSLEQFRGLLLRQPDMFVASVTKRLLQYGLGRELGYYDQPAVRAIVRDARRSNYRFSAIVMGIVTSQPFRMRKMDAGSGPAGLQASR